MVSSSDSLSVIDLFCGVGGFSTGFVAAGGYRIVAGNDHDVSAVEAFTFNHPDAAVSTSPISDIDADSMMRSLGLKRGQIDVLIGGPPCQGFTRAAQINSEQRTRFIDDPRNFLFFEFLRFVDALHPRAVLVENVPEIVSRADGWYRTQIFEALNNLGYQYTQSTVLNAADFGVPQRRRRAFIYASREAPITWPTPTHDQSPAADSTVKPWRTVADAISDLAAAAAEHGYLNGADSAYQTMMRAGSFDLTDHQPTSLSEIQSRRLAHLQQGQGMETLPPSLRPKSSYDNAYRRMSWDQPALTITTWLYHPGSGMYFHPSEHRTITVREGARLQSLPDTARFVGSKRAKCKQVGNAVPPMLVEAIARQVHEALN